MTKRSLYFTSDSEYSTPVSVLQGRTGPKQRPLMALEHDGFTRLTWQSAPAAIDTVELILVFVVEPATSGSNRILVYHESKDRIIAECEVICSDPYQRIAIAIPQEAFGEDGTLTLQLKLANEGYLWLFAPDASARDGLEWHVPHLIDASGPADAFMDALASLASIQTFSWKEGCVLDALQAYADLGEDSRAAAAIRQHLDYFGFSSGVLEYETPRSMRVANELDTIETTLPFAHAARIDPQHPWVDLAMDFWRQLIAKNGQVQDEEMISSEGAYTVAYPMVLIAQLRNEPKWEAIAENLLVETFNRLVQKEGIYLRHYTDGRRTHRNWVRGLCWQMLGHVQVLKLQAKPSEILKQQLTTLAEFAAQYQLENGMWACFVDEPEVAADTSGSVGVAAAMALAAKHGFLPEEYLERALRCRETARTYLTPQGFLGGCSQSNKGGEGLQRSDYRVTLSYALGLYGQLEVATLGDA
ncbi:glycoside hydrolase family 88 protein [Coraliomargarita algicola]|uniref:Glycoside hydrolase family 88 protein n=1 Tax=Coraliomargarita algicola TaxID=3092156 RepID=A0ABZ0RKF6_9BACT|nr:glycoside hydrolase family 88 protein [Coraliomargarita sp. J2-16]WPJ96686.1 glycoside hydrolase family 88 protein [Coraliomargarita sp. J2-16]